MTRLNTRAPVFFVSALAFGLCCCTHALPGRSPVKEVFEYTQRAEQAEAQAQSYAEQAKHEIERAEMLVAEAKAQLERADQAQRRCSELVRRASKPKPKKVVLKPEEEAAASTTPTLPGQEPPYSPSDAPIKK